MNTREDLTQEIEELLNTATISYKDKVNAIAQVIIDMGVAIEPNIEGPLTLEHIKSLEKEYYSEPTLGKALILQGALMLAWQQ